MKKVFSVVLTAMSSVFLFSAMLQNIFHDGMMTGHVEERLADAELTRPTL